ncbi:hypothetical protein [Bradyrhizobium sp.]|uniref:hypothetical protein n=1 Tax=Bradyrhizobium sp. TaxID=376 RepID=UPI0039E67C69
MPPGHSNAQRPADYFEATFRKFQDVASSRPIVSRDILLGERTVRLRVSAGAMAQAILPAFAHLVTEPVTEPDLTVCAWDSESTGSAPVSPGWTIQDYRREGFISGFNDDRFHTALQFDPLILRMLDMERRHALYWTRSAAEMPHWEIGAPMRPLLHEWLQRVGYVAVHGGAIGHPDGGLFLAGAGGRGKSNVALSCLRSGLRYASDDFCFLSAAPWVVHSLYSTGKLSGGDLARHPLLDGLASNPDRLDREKAIFFLHDRFRERLVRSMPLRGVVLPWVVAHGPSAISRISPEVAQRETALSTIELSRWTGQHTLVKVQEMLRDLPCFELQIGSSIDEIPPLLTRLLSDLRA